METDFQNDKSSNTTNTSAKIYGDNAAPIFACLSMICSAWIIISNAFVLICFLNHRKRMSKSTFTIHILTLSFNDLMSGVFTLPVYVTSFTTQVTYEFCILRFVLFVSAQVVVLLHILGICVYRFLTVCQATSPQRGRNQGRLVVIYVLVIWIITLIIHISTFLIWGNYRHTLSICSLNEILQNNYKTVITHLLCLFIVPAVFTNVIYLVMIVKLCFYARKLASVNSYNISATQSSSSNRASSFSFQARSQTNRNETDGVAWNDHSSMNAAADGRISCSCNHERSDLSTNKRQQATYGTKTSDNEGKGKNGGRIELNNMPSFKSQRQALVTIGKANSEVIKTVHAQFS